jgi:hypothetical protein
MKSLGLILLLVAACTSPANVAGTFTVGVTNHNDACGIGWTVGQQASGVQVVITQSGANATATVMGGGALGLDVLVGTNVFAGTVSGDDVNLNITGTRAMQKGNCTYTLNAEITGKLAGNELMGTIDYTGAGNGASDCAGITGCLSSQAFDGTRPPA